ncbi:MAG: hypothetical protein IVW56_06085 [Candidatus Binataceae bacterium]|nr:hypothetical protein [Candidatus Binataceae bacterium]
MKGCLNENDLIRIQHGDDFEFAAERLHLRKCPACAARADELASDTRRIAAALAATAADSRALRQSRRAGFGRTAVLERGRLRKFGVYAGTAVCGGTVAFAIMMALGWRPMPVSPMQTARATMTRTPERRAHLNSDQVTNGEATPSYGTVSDPVSDVVYGENSDLDSDSGTASEGSEATGELLFCAPGEDRMLCADSGDQG